MESHPPPPPKKKKKDLEPSAPLQSIDDSQETQTAMEKPVGLKTPLSSSDLPPPQRRAGSSSARKKHRPPGLGLHISADHTESIKFLPSQLPKTPVSTTSSLAKTSLHKAVLAGDVEAVKAWIEKDASSEDVNRQDENGFAAIHIAASLKDSKKGLEVAKLLLRVGADPLLQDNDGYHSLHWAAAIGNHEILRCLAIFQKLDAKVDSPSATGETALHRACRLGRISAIRALIDDLHADIWCRSATGETPYDVAGSFSGHVNDAVRAKVRGLLCTLCPTMRTLILHHPECLLHETPVGHFEGQDRIVFIFSELSKVGIVQDGKIPTRKSSSNNSDRRR